MSLSGQKDPVLALAPDYALKPLRRDDNRGLREIAFYEALKLADRSRSRFSGDGGVDDDDPRSILNLWLNIFKRGGYDETSWELPLVEIVSWRRMKREIELLRRLAPLAPSYYGVMDQPTDPLSFVPSLSNSAYLLLNDVTSNFSKPCVLDLKMGQRSYEPDAPLAKIDKEIGKYVHQVLYGFRIVGMRVYDPQTGFHTFDKTFGRSLKTDDAVVTALKGFFQRRGDREEDESSKDMSSDVRKRVIENLIPMLLRIKNWFEENTMLGFYASSLLIVYEGDVTSRRHTADVKMIDFGHVRRQSGGDRGYLYGIKMLIGMLNSILEDEKKDFLART